MQLNYHLDIHEVSVKRVDQAVPSILGVVLAIR